jgi:hypothetical protein
MGKDVVKVIWAVPCSYHGTEALLEMCKFFRKKNLNFEVIGAYKGSDASERICDNAGEFDLVVLDSSLKYLEVVERFIQVIALREFSIIRIIETGEFQLEKAEKHSLFQMKGDQEGPFQDIERVLEKIF